MKKINRPGFIFVIIGISLTLFLWTWGISKSNPNKSLYEVFFGRKMTPSIVGYDWCYPSCDDDVQSSFKFSSDGTFTSSQIMFGGSSRWGNWEEIDDNTFRLTTTRISTNSSNDQLPEPQIVTLTSDKKLRVGSTTYVGEH